jgi:hypothetical protein
MSHQGDITEKVFDAKTAAIEAAKVHNVMKEVFDVLMKIKFDEKLLQAFLMLRFPLKSGQSDTSKKHIIKNFLDADGQTIERNTAWNGWNSYTKFTNHQRRVHVTKDNVTTQSSLRLQSVYHGSIAKDNLEAFNEIIALTESKNAIDKILSQVGGV